MISRSLELLADVYIDAELASQLDVQETNVSEESAQTIPSVALGTVITSLPEVGIGFAVLKVKE